MSGLERAGSWAAAVLFAAACGLAATDAQAVRYENIEVKVTPSAANLSYGAPGSYTFYVANYTNGTINNIRFRAYLSAGEFAATNPTSAGAAATCARIDAQTIDCSIVGGIVSYGYSTFDFAITAPTASTTATSISLDWDVRFGQGQSTSYISTTTTPGISRPNDISLIQNSDVEAKAYIPPDGFNLYTGTAIPSATDPFTVGVIVDPAANKVVTAGILENAKPCVQPTLNCAQLEVLRILVLPNGDLDSSFKAEYTGDPATTDLDSRLVIVLRFAPSAVKGSLSQLHVFYTPDDGSTVYDLAACPKRQPDYVPQVTDPPCVARKVEFTKRTAPDPSLIGVVEVELWAAKNGWVDAGW